jgi:hypothetical protein
MLAATPALAMICCGGKGAMMCGKGGMAMTHAGRLLMLLAMPSQQPPPFLPVMPAWVIAMPPLPHIPCYNSRIPHGSGLSRVRRWAVLDALPAEPAGVEAV